MKARIMFDTTREFRDHLLQASKDQNLQFAQFIRKVLRDFMAKPYKLYENKVSTREEEASLEFLPYTADEGETGENIIASE